MSDTLPPRTLAFRITYITIEAFRCLALLFFVRSTVLFLRRTNRTFKSDTPTILTLIFLSLQLLLQISTSIMHYLTVWTDAQGLFIPWVFTFSLGFFCQNTALFFNIYRWLLLLKAKTVDFDAQHIE